MLVKYIGECMVYMNYQHQYWYTKPTHEDQNCNTNQISILDVNVHQGEKIFIYPSYIIWANTILNRIETRTMLPTYPKVFSW
jgi:hypothetical protein